MHVLEYMFSTSKESKLQYSTTVLEWSLHFFVIWNILSLKNKKCMFFINLCHWHWFTRDRLVQMIDKLYMVLALTATSIEDRASRWELWLLRNAHAYWCVSTENKDEEFTGLGIRSFALSLFALSLFALLLKIAHITVKSDCEQFALVFLNLSDRERIASFALYKRATMSNLLRFSWKKSHGINSLFFTSELLFCSFAHNKWVICSKNQWANSQPWAFILSAPSS